MTRQQAAEDDEDSEYAANVELARLLKIMIRRKQREHLPRYKGGGRSKGVISLYARKDSDLLEFRLSYDVVCRMHAWLMHDMTEPPRDLLRSDLDSLRIVFVRFRRMSTPLLIIRLAEWAPKPQGNRLTRRPRGWRFTTTVRAPSIGMDASGGSLPRLDIIPWPAVKGYIIRLPDTHRAYKARRDDVSEFLDSLDLNEPPRFRHGQKDPAYLAKLAAEAAERTNQ